MKYFDFHFSCSPKINALKSHQRVPQQLTSINQSTNFPSFEEIFSIIF